MTGGIVLLCHGVTTVPQWLNYMRKKYHVKNQSNTIVENLKRLNEGKVCAELRKEELLRLQNTLREEIRKCDFLEKKEIMSDTFDEVRSSERIISKWIGEIDSEIERVTLARDALHTSDIDELKSAFSAYVLSDTALSVKNITMALYDFDQLILSAKTFVEKI